MRNTVRNLAGFVFGWLFILALVFGMEAVHALEFRSVGNNNPWNFEYIGSSGSDLCNQLRAAKQATANSNQTVTAETVPTLTRTSITGQCKIKYADPCVTDWQGNTTCPTQTITPATTYYSRCTSAEPWVKITASAPPCPADPCPVTPEGDPPDYVGGGTVAGVSGPLCYDGCIVTPVEDLQIGLCITIDSQAGKKGCKAESAVSLKRAGGACPADSTARRDFIGTLHSITDETGNTYSLDPDEPSNCATGNGKTICLETDPDKDCGTVNGETVCVPKSQRNNKDAVKPDKVCTDVDGKAHCISRTKTTEPDKPPAPAEPAAGKITKGEPGSTVTGGEANGTTINVYNSPSQSGSGSSSGGSGSGGSSGTSGSSGTGTETGTGSCGGSGQPSCAVRIDETGTPSTASAFSTESYSTATTGAATSIESKMAETDPLSGWGGLSSVMGIIPVLPYGECQSITFEVWGGRSVTFPGQRACVGLEKLKTYEAYFLSVVTIFSCVLVMLRARAGDKED